MHLSVRPFSKLVALCAALGILSACGGGGGGSSSPPPPPAPSPSPTATADANAAAFTCPTSDTAASVAVSRNAEGTRRFSPRRPPTTQAAVAATQLLAVNYDAPTANAQKAALAARESTLGTTKMREFNFSRTNVITHILSVPTPQVSHVMAALRLTPGFRSVSVTGQRRHATGVTSTYSPNDPYFNGFAATPATPLLESATVPGQWDMHAIRLEYAFGYSLFGGQYTNPAALGTTAVKIAVIDTGEDTSHPELHPKVVYQRCFITNSAGVQSNSNFTTDEDGHGTDVAGIAAEATNNSLGFTGAGGNALLYAYRVFPTPDDNCSSPTSTDQQCGTSPLDIASAIEDAVAKHANIISMSLGGGACVNGSDSDSTEGAAVADAIAANIIVIAASGNAGGVGVESPACDSGVIAVGASAIDDGSPNGSSILKGGTAAAPLEYVASYSNFGSPSASLHNSGAWGIVAPGGDPTDSSDTDDLHWIENIWTTTPFQANANDSNFTGSCAPDHASVNGTIDCRILIAGTSMATPHVAGAAALILSVNPAYQSPGLMKSLLCTTTDEINDANEGCGRLDIYRAMAVALNDPNNPPNQTP